MVGKKFDGAGAEPRLRTFDRQALESLDVVSDVDSVCLYVLTTPEGSLELYRSIRDELIIWAYTRITDLVASCGDGQPYVRATPAEVVEFGRAFDGALLVALDVWHPEGVRYPAPEPSEMEPMKHIELTDDNKDAQSREHSSSQQDSTLAQRRHRPSSRREGDPVPA